MQYVVEGILFGLGLTILLGPLFIVLVQSSIEGGSRAGLIAASGIWISDVLFVVLGLNFVKTILPFVSSDGFKFYVALLGGLVLIGVGLNSFFKKAQLVFDKKTMSKKGVIGYWMQGFMVNTINPFTLIFWLTTITTFVFSRHLSQLEGILFTGSIVATIVVTDVLKVILAKYLRKSITQERLGKINKIAGIALIVFGFILMLKGVS